MSTNNLVRAIKCLSPEEDADKLLDLLKIWKLQRKELLEIRDYWRDNKICVKEKIAYYLMFESGIWDGEVGAVGYDTTGKQLHHWKQCRCF